MPESSRRNFLAASGAGVAVAGIAAAIPIAAVATEKSVSLPAHAEPLAVHISDPASGLLSLMVAGREVLVKDHDLVARIAHAAGGK